MVGRLVDVLVVEGARKAMRDATGKTPPDGWARMSEADARRLPLPVPPPRVNEDPPADVILGANGRRWSVDGDGKLVEVL